MKNEVTVMKNQNGEETHLLTIGDNAISQESKAAFAEKIEILKAAKKDELVNIAPVYWKAESGDEKVMVFLGVNKRVKKETGEVTFVCEFWDGERKIIMGQLAALDWAGSNMNMCNHAVKVTCIEASSQKAKRFKFEVLKG